MEYPTALVARELGIGEMVLRRWVRLVPELRARPYAQVAFRANHLLALMIMNVLYRDGLKGRPFAPAMRKILALCTKEPWHKFDGVLLVFNPVANEIEFYPEREATQSAIPLRYVVNLGKTCAELEALLLDGFGSSQRLPGDKPASEMKLDKAIAKKFNEVSRSRVTN